MNQNRFLVVPHPLTRLPSRRDVLRALAGAGLWLQAVPPPDTAQARKKRKNRVTFNAFGCINVGGFCKNAAQCCSGICQGKKGKQKCRAHHTGGCRTGIRDTTCAASGTDIPCASGTGALEGRCNTTTGKAAYCAVTRDCFPCRNDAECEEFCGAGAACIPCADCPDTGGASCATADGACSPPPRPL